MPRGFAFRDLGPLRVEISVTKFLQAKLATPTVVSIAAVLGAINAICVEYRWQSATIFRAYCPESDQARSSKPGFDEPCFDEPGFGKPAFDEFRPCANSGCTGSNAAAAIQQWRDRRKDSRVRCDP